MVLDHLDAVWRSALAASGDRVVAEDVTSGVLTEARRDAPADELIRAAVLAAVRRAPAPAFAAMAPAEREAMALARLAGCRTGDIAAALGIDDGAARRLLTDGLRSTLRHRRASGPRRLPPALGCGSAAS